MDLIDEVVRADDGERMRDPMSPTRLIGLYSTNENAWINPSRETPYRLLRRKLLLRTSFCIIRMAFLLLFFYLDGTLELNYFIEPLVEILLVHEGIILLNFFHMTVFELIGGFNQQDNAAASEDNRFHRIIEYTDILANILFFIWFLWGNYRFLFLKDDVIYSLQRKSIFIK